MNRKFDNKNFWNKRYSENPNLGSGPGSRGNMAIDKKNFISSLIKANNLETVLDYGCGDLHSINPEQCKEYVGTDISDVILQKNSLKHSDKIFVKPENIPDKKFDLVVCQDVLIHQDSINKFNSIFYTCLEKTKKYFLFSILKNELNAVANVYYYKVPNRFLKNKIMSYRDVDLFLHEVEK
jgi:SAM-dependent methyltransferase